MPQVFPHSPTRRSSSAFVQDLRWLAHRWTLAIQRSHRSVWIIAGSRAALMSAEPLLELYRVVDSPDPDATLRKLGPQVYESSVGKHRSQSWWKRWQVQRWIGPTLASFGYTDPTP